MVASQLEYKSVASSVSDIGVNLLLNYSFFSTGQLSDSNSYPDRILFRIHHSTIKCSSSHLPRGMINAYIRTVDQYVLFIAFGHALL